MLYGMASKNITILAFLFLPLLSASADVATIKISEVQQTVDLKSQIAKVVTKFTIDNVGPRPVTQFSFVIEKIFNADNIAYLKLQIGQDELEIEKQLHSKEPNEWLVRLKQALQPHNSVTVIANYKLVHRIQPHPASVLQNQNQLVKFVGNSRFYSAYPVDRSRVTYELGTKNIENYTKLDSTIVAKTSISYGPYTSVEPFTETLIELHYENNSPFLVVSELIRTIEVSHWGNIAVKDEVTAEQVGAKLIGPFSRYEFQTERNSGPSSVRSFRTTLPGTAKDIYYRDVIGNVSTSNLQTTLKNTFVELRPRFPLFGGWNTQYALGYNVPTSEYLFQEGDKYTLKMNFIDNLYRDFIVNNTLLKIILPEGSKVGALKFPYEVQRLQDGLHFTYLDVTGRPVILAKKNNLVADHVTGFEVNYEFPKWKLFLEPFYVSTAMMLFFLSVIIYVRLDFSFYKDAKAEKQLKLAGFRKKVGMQQEARLRCLKAIDNLFESTKFDKNLAEFTKKMKTLCNNLKNECGELSSFITDIKDEYSSIGDQLAEIQKYDKLLRETINQQQTLYAEKLIPGKIDKASFIEAEQNFAKRKSDYLNRIAKMVKEI